MFAIYCLQPTAYSLDTEKIRNLQFNRVREGGRECDESSISLLDAFSEVADQAITHVDVFVNSWVGQHETTVYLESTQRKFAGSWFNCQLLAALLTLRTKGVEYPFGVAWFWFEADDCVDEPLETDHFFVVHEKRGSSPNTVTAVPT